MKFTHEEILNAIIVSKILEPQLLRNPSLGELFGNANNPNISYGSEFIPTVYQRKVFERRAKIRLMEDANEVSKANAETFQKVLAFIEKKPENQVFTVVFNCNNEHFTIWCGLLDDCIDVLCALTGGHIPDYVFEKRIK